MQRTSTEAVGAVLAPPTPAAAEEPEREMTLADRDIRQRDLVPPQVLAATRVHVIGVGAIGSQVARILASVGAPNITIVDHDKVGFENLANQGFNESDVGRPKVEAIAEIMRAKNSKLVLRAVPERFGRQDWADYVQNRPKDGHDVLFCCVDNIETRKMIWDQVHKDVALFVDARMAAEVMYVYAVDPTSTRAVRVYESKFFSAGEAVRDACTSKSTLYTADIAAGLMVAQFTKWLRGWPCDIGVNLNLPAGEWGIDT
jgi:molybdopterin/thiamine biosynthesis adenylyltransferase